MVVTVGICLVYYKSDTLYHIYLNNSSSKSILATVNTDKTVVAVTKANNIPSLPMKVESVYELIKKIDGSKPSLSSFSYAYDAYKKVYQAGLVKKNYLTLIDFSISSCYNRLWVINMDTYEVEMISLVAHGNKSGTEYATSFSNKLNSLQSSLGVYLTGEEYQGKNGYSMRLDGLSIGYNDMARERGIVVHGADYVSTEYIETSGRLGRSQGCPAVPAFVNEQFINLIKDRSVMFIYHPIIEKMSISINYKLSFQGIEQGNI
jgi:hypothetical protein